MWRPRWHCRQILLQTTWSAERWDLANAAVRLSSLDRVCFNHVLVYSETQWCPGGTNETMRAKTSEYSSTIPVLVLQIMTRYGIRLDFHKRAQPKFDAGTLLWRTSTCVHLSWVHSKNWSDERNCLSRFFYWIHQAGINAFPIFSLPEALIFGMLPRQFDGDVFLLVVNFGSQRIYYPGKWSSQQLKYAVNMCRKILIFWCMQFVNAKLSLFCCHGFILPCNWSLILISG